MTHSISISWVPLYREVWSLCSKHNGIVVGQRAFRNLVSTQTRVKVGTDCFCLASRSVIGAKILNGKGSLYSLALRFWRSSTWVARYLVSAPPKTSCPKRSLVQYSIRKTPLNRRTLTYKSVTVISSDDNQGVLIFADFLQV